MAYTCLLLQKPWAFFDGAPVAWSYRLFVIRRSFHEVWWTWRQDVVPSCTSVCFKARLCKCLGEGVMSVRPSNECGSTERCRVVASVTPVPYLRGVMFLVDLEAGCPDRHFPLRFPAQILTYYSTGKLSCQPVEGRAGRRVGTLEGVVLVW
jgi:hypothetical protein